MGKNVEKFKSRLLDRPNEPFIVDYRIVGSNVYVDLVQYTPFNGRDYFREMSEKISVKVWKKCEMHVGGFLNDFTKKNIGEYRIARIENLDQNGMETKWWKGNQQIFFYYKLARKDEGFDDQCFPLNEKYERGRGIPKAYFDDRIIPLDEV